MNPLTQATKQALAEFDSNVNDLRQMTHWGEETDSPVKYFGYKTQRQIPTIIGGTVTELFTVTDWAHVKKHITKSHLALVEVLLQWCIENEYTSDDLAGGKALDSYDLKSLLTTYKQELNAYEK